MRVRRVHHEARYFARRIATSGEEPEVRSSTHKVLKFQVRRQRPGGPSMKRFDVLLDVSAEELNVPFDLDLVTVRYGAFADPKGEWAAVPILQPTVHVALEIKFPENKPPRNLRYSISTRAARRKYQPLENDAFRVQRSNSSSLIFEIDHPLLGHSYRIDWEW